MCILSSTATSSAADKVSRCLLTHCLSLTAPTALVHGSTLSYNTFPYKSMNVHISNLIFTSRQSMGSESVRLIGRGPGLRSAGSCSQSKGVNLKWFKHEGIKIKYSHKSNTILLKNENELFQEKSKTIHCGLFWFVRQTRCRIKFESSNWVQPD